MRTYRVELRFDIEAENDEDAREMAARERIKRGGEITAIFDDQWEEIRVRPL